MIQILKSKYVLLMTALLLAAALLLVVGTPVDAQNFREQAQQGVCDVGGGCDQGTNVAETVKNVVNILLYAVGVLSVIMIIVGAIRFVISGGDSNATQGARNTILYAIVGLVLAFVAWGIVNFVIDIF